MKTATLIIRILFGLAFVVFGLNGFLHFLPTPPLPKGPAGDFTGALVSTGYIKVVMALQLVGGLLVLSGRWTPLGLLVLGPILVNILLYHLLMDQAGLPMALGFSAIALFLLARYWSAFRALFKPYPPAAP